MALEDLAEHHAVGQILPRFVFAGDLCDGTGNNARCSIDWGMTTTPSASPNIKSPVSIRTPPPDLSPRFNVIAMHLFFFRWQRRPAERRGQGAAGK
jgi:hypothetical protein